MPSWSCLFTKTGAARELCIGQLSSTYKYDDIELLRKKSRSVIIYSATSMTLYDRGIVGILLVMVNVYDAVVQLLYKISS